jgi:hypothetical protein
VVVLLMMVVLAVMAFRLSVVPFRFLTLQDQDMTSVVVAGLASMVAVVVLAVVVVQATVETTMISSRSRVRQLQLPIIIDIVNNANKEWYLGPVH